MPKVAKTPSKAATARRNRNMPRPRNLVGKTEGGPGKGGPVEQGVPPTEEGQPPQQGPAAGDFFSDSVVREFTHFVGLDDMSVPDKKDFIRNLNSSVIQTEAFYKSLLATIPRCTYDGPFDIDSYIPKLTIGSEAPITLRQLKSGSFGIIYMGSDKNIYKQIRLEQSWNLVKIMNFYREFLIEGFIQTVLQNDENQEMAKRVAKLSGMYIVNPTGRDADGEDRLFIRQDDYHCYYRMEYIPHTLNTYSAKHGELPVGACGALSNAFRGERSLMNCVMGKKYLSKAQMANIFIQIGEILSYFYKKYRFVHRDLHSGNVMFDESGDVTLIDFGLSCMEVDGHIYSVRNVECKSYDLLTYTTSLYENKQTCFSKDAALAMYRSMNIGLEEAIGNIYNLLESRRQINISGKVITPVFHKTYWSHIPQVIMQIPDHRLLVFPDNLEGFMSYWSGVQEGGKRRRRRRFTRK